MRTNSITCHCRSGKSIKVLIVICLIKLDFEQVTILKSRTHDRYLLIGNTHLYFHPDADHIRLLQMAFFMLYVKHLYHSIISEFKLKKEQVSIIFCGDFNSVPECGIFKLMTEKFVPEDFIDFKSSK